jgi:glycosyltransferase involved in cell wall biosynthesis
MDHIGIFNAYWALHSNVVYTAGALASGGYEVDLFLFDSDEFICEQMLDRRPGVAVHRLGKLPEPPRIDRPPVNGTRKLVRNLAFKVRWRFRKISPKAIRERFWPETTIFPGPVLDRTRELMTGKHYKALIGVEKGGLVWACLAARSSPAPVFYHSLELYTRDHPFCAYRDLNRRLKRAEEKCHPRCYATIVQDERRGRALLSDNEVRRSMKSIYLPISRLEKPGRVESRFFQERFCLASDTVLVLIFGLMGEHRLSPQLAEIAQSFPENWRLVFHGYGPSGVIQRVRETDRRGRVLLSLDQVPNDELPRVVSSATIGLVFYGANLVNDRLTAFSSEKIALCLQCGLPVIAFRYEGYEFVEQERCGVLISSLEEMPEAVQAVLQAFREYHRNAIAAFHRHFVFETNIQPLLMEIERLL